MALNAAGERGDGRFAGHRVCNGSGVPDHLQVVADEGLRLAFLLTRDRARARAEDLVQETFVRVLRRWRTAGVPDEPFAYARKVVINEYLAWRRLRSSDESVGLIGEREVEDQTEQIGDRDLMWRLLGELPARGRTVLVLRYYEQLTDAEIAVILGCKLGTVRSISARSIASLRAHPMMAIVLEEA